jgi:amino acid adenylation domain-containing protein
MTVQQVGLGRPPWAQGGSVPSGHVPFPSDAVSGSIPARLAAVAASRPGHPALRGPAGPLTFAEFDAAATDVAAGLLHEMGQGSEPVALLLDHDVPLVVHLFGVLRAGKIIQVLDPTAPPATSRALLADSGARVVVAGEAHTDLALELVAGQPVQVVSPELRAGPASAAALPEITPDTAAMLAYTSGTTGAPKGAVMSHRALLHLVRGATDALAIGSDDRMPMVFPLSLAVAAYPMLLPLLNGATLSILDVRSVGLAPVPGWLAEERITVAYLAPTVVRFLEDAVGDTTFPDLRLIVLGGERVDGDVVDLTRRLFGAELLVGNGYGLTETGVLSFSFVGPGEQVPEGGVPVGHPIAETELLILDDDGEEVAPGDTGEVWVRSRYLFSGYWGRPELSERLLVPEPAPAAAGLMRYGTGDLGRLDPQRGLEVVGRSDAQVKVRGHKVVVGEVEESLLALEIVNDAVITTRAREGADTELIAHVVPAANGNGNGAVTATDIRRALAEVVRPPMVPAQILLLDALPQLPNGKLDRRALAEPAGERPDLGHEPTAPRSATEHAIARIWEELLGIRPVGVDDDFFDLGGDSLVAAAALIRVADELGVHVPMAALLGGATPAEIAKVVDAGEPTARRSRLVKVHEAAGRPLVWCHDLHGSAFRFRHLAEALGPDQAVWSFESPFLEGHRPPFSRLETLALAYATDLMREDPDGPYLLGGYSFGGVLAFEMARALVREGKQVALLAIVDVGPAYRGEHYSLTHAPERPWLGIPMPPDPSLPLRQRARQEASLLRRSPKGALRQWAVRAGVDRALDPVRWEAELRRDGRISPGQRLWWAWQRHWELGAKHWDWPNAHYDGRIDLLWADDSGSADATMGWGPLTSGPVEIHRIPGPHAQLMEPGAVEPVAEVLRSLLAEIDI